MTVSFVPGDWASIESLFQAGNSHVLVQFIGGGLSDTMTLTTIDNGSVRNMGSVGVPCAQFVNVNSLGLVWISNSTSQFLLSVGGSCDTKGASPVVMPVLTAVC